MQKYDVTGMSCAACSSRIEKVVSKLDGVKNCSVNLLLNSMIVEGDIDPDTVIMAVERAGYGAKLRDSGASQNSTVFQNSGANASANVGVSQGMDAFQNSATYQNAGVSQDSCTLQNSDSVSQNSCTLQNSGAFQNSSTVQNSGGGKAEKGGSKRAKKRIKTYDEEISKMKKRLFSSLAFLIVLMYVSMGHMMFGFPLPAFFNGNHVAMGLLEMLLTIIIMVINQKFFISGFKSLIRRAPNMDALVAIGSMTAFIYSTVSLFLMTDAVTRGDNALAGKYMDEFYFESAAMILTLITLGKLLEAYSKGKTTNALKSLALLKPQSATVLVDGKEVTVPIAKIKIGDTFIVHPGEAVPVDGIVLSGNSAIDESMLTGESVPSDKSENSLVFSGTLNSYGFLTCRATKVGEDTTLSKIIKTVEEVSMTKAPIAKIADKVSGVFVPTVIGIALVTVIVWLAVGKSVGFALARGISVLVISCPCALGLATPVAIMVGSGVGAKNGILFKTAESLEKTGEAKIVVLDKTGTITEGKPSVTDVVPCVGVTSSELLTYAFALEAKSEHPLSLAVKDEAERKNIERLEVENFQNMSGNGLIARLFGKTLVGGNYNFIKNYAKISDEIRDASDRLSNEGKTPLYFSYDGKLLGVIAVADTIKPDSVDAIKKLQKSGLKVVMLTGDNQKTANAIGKIVGVDEVISGVLPDGKQRVIDDLKKQGSVIMVGDGINDALALTTADVGIAIGKGSDVAIDSADVVLMKNSLEGVFTAVNLSKSTLRNIKENLFWAFFYNSLGIPLAAGAFINLFGWQLNPMFGAAAMSLSSFFVVMNALRLNLFKPNKNSKNKNVNRSGDTNKNCEVNCSGGTNNNCDKEVVMNKTLKINGMMCGHCEAHVKKALEAIDGVKSAEANHVNGTAKVVLDKEVSDNALKSAVEAEGYTVTEII